MRSFDDEVTVTIDGMDSKSRGIARMDGYVVFVPGALVGETILAKFVERRKHYGVATIKSILKSSDYRVPPKCEYYEACGGCDLQHASYDYHLIPHGLMNHQIELAELSYSHTSSSPLPRLKQQLDQP
jgi:23S rRNA (uracil1939-C5)-methyltransferase